MHSGTSIHLRRLAVWPAGWLAYFAGLAGAMSAALTLIAMASEHYVEGVVALTEVPRRPEIDGGALPKARQSCRDAEPSFSSHGRGVRP